VESTKRLSPAHFTQDKFMLANPFKLLFALAIALVLAGCAGHLNTIKEGDDGALMLKGHDPVAYFTDGRHVLGAAQFKAEHEGGTYRFASAANRDAFTREPKKFAPQYGGFCANGIAYGIPWGGDPDTFKIVDGKLYIFGGAGSMKYFLMDEKRNIGLADKYWADEIQGSSATVRRYWRLVNRVPHYKSGAELEAEWKARQNAGSKAQ
jgi:YHS domain-containing protein